jgi:hypothetical protein
MNKQVFKSKSAAAKHLTRTPVLLRSVFVCESKGGPHDDWCFTTQTPAVEARICACPGGFKIVFVRNHSGSFGS